LPHWRETYPEQAAALLRLRRRGGSRPLCPPLPGALAPHPGRRGVAGAPQLISTAYPPPLDRLLTLGDAWKMHDWPDYPGPGLGPEHIPDLIRLATDQPDVAIDTSVSANKRYRAKQGIF